MESEVSLKEYLENQIIALQNAIEEVKNNHLIHVQERIDKIEGKIDKLVWLLITSLIGTIINLIK